jgi:hypothetical protein
VDTRRGEDCVALDVVTGEAGYRRSDLVGDPSAVVVVAVRVYALGRRGDGVPGCERKRGSSWCARCRPRPVVAMLTMAGVAPALVGGGKRGRREKASLGQFGLGPWPVLGRLGPGGEKERERKQLGRGRSWAATVGWTGPREVKERNFLFYFFKKN